MNSTDFNKNIFSGKIMHRLLFLVVIASFLFTGQNVSARDHDNITTLPILTPTPTPVIDTLLSPGKFIRKVKSSTPPDVDFRKNFKLDLNKDGVMDKLVCSNQDYSVTIYDGKKLKNVLYKWNGPVNNTRIDPKRPKNPSVRIYTGCEVIEVVKGQFDIVVSGVFNHVVYGLRIPSQQFILRNVRADKKAKVGVIKNPDGTVFRSAARSVNCTAYPDALVEKGYKPGVLCFFAGYDSGIPPAYEGGPWRYGDKTAVVKIERTGKKYAYKDLTGSSGLIWSGGMYGTPMSAFPSRTSRLGTRLDGLSMMEGDWIDYDKDGLPDLISVGQHSSIRASNMRINTNKPEGISFTTSNILTVTWNAMTEFLAVSAFNEQDKSIDLPCVYISGENGNGTKSYDVEDHVRCYENNKWTAYKLPGSNGKYSSAQRGASIKKDAKGNIYISAPNLKPSKLGLVPATPPVNYFKVNPRYFAR